MWIFTKYGFFSAVAGTDRIGNVDPNIVVMRARECEHLQELVKRFNLKVTIGKSVGRDYGFRIVLKRIDFLPLMWSLAEDVDYSNFKSAVARYQGMTKYEQALHDVWTRMARLQPFPPYALSESANGRDTFEDLRDPWGNDWDAIDSQILPKSAISAGEIRDIPKQSNKKQRKAAKKRPKFMRHKR